MAGATAAQAASPAVSVYPSPGTNYNLPRTQITFRGIAPSAIGTVSVVGSVTGAHTGRVAADSDNKGGSFLPAKPFTAGETVTVTTGLNIVGGQNGKFSFVVVHQSRPIQPMPLPVVSAGSNGLQHFRSRPDLLPPSVEGSWGTQDYSTIHTATADARVPPESTDRRGAYQKYDFTFRCTDLQKLISMTQALALCFK